MNVYLNIETFPPISTRPEPGRVKVRKDIKDPEKIHARQVEGALEAWKKLGLQPWTAQVFCVTLLVDDAPEPVLLMHFDEQYLLTSLQDMLLALGAYPTYVTFNGLDFDYRMLRVRAVKYGLERLAVHMSHPKWGDGQHLDLFRTLGESGTLDEWAYFFGIKHDNPISGGDIATCMAQSRHDEVARHAASRVTILREIHRKMVAVGL